MFLTQPPAGVAEDDPQILEFSLANVLRLETRSDPKGSRQVHVVQGTVASVVARVRDVEELHVNVNLSGSDGLGSYVAMPDGKGVVRIDVPLPAVGSQIQVRLPGTGGQTTAWNVPPGMVYMLQPMGDIAWKHPHPWATIDTNWVVADPIFVTVEE